MNGNIIMGFLFFIMALAVMVVFIEQIGDFLDITQQSNNMNCKGYIFEGNANHTLSFNSSLNNGNSGNPTGCLAVKLYMPYLLLAFLFGGLGALLSGRAGDMLGFGGQQQPQYGE